MRIGAGKNEGLWTCLGAVGVYCALHLALRLGASRNVGENDPLAALRVEILRGGYSLDQPPLFDWLAWAAIGIVGDAPIAFQLLRYGLLGATMLVLFLLARRVTGSNLWSLLSVEAYALIYQLSWRGHEGFTHPLTAMLSIALIWLALLRLIEDRRLVDYLFLGLAAGLGLLASYWVHMGLIAVVGAAALSPPLRRVMTSPKIVLSVAVAAIVAAPYVVWQLEQAPLGALLQRLSPRWPEFADLIETPKAALLTPLLALSPMVPLAMILFPRGVLARKLWSGDAAADAIAAALLSSLVLLALLSVFWGGSGYPEHHLLPLLLLAPIWVMDRARRSDHSRIRRRNFAWIGLAVAVLAFGMRGANLYGLDPVCRKCYFAVPYEALVAELRADEALDGVERLVALSVRDSGQLAALWPEAFVHNPRADLQPVDLDPTDGPLLAIWRAEDDPEHVVGLLVSRFGVPRETARDLVARAQPHVIGWPHLWRPDGYRSTEWRSALVPETSR